MNRINYLLVLIILILLFSIIKSIYRNRSKIEGFYNFENKIFYKKTLDFRKIWYNSIDNYTVWEPETDGDYYPIGHIITKGKGIPKNPEILVKSNIENNKDRPLRYELISFITIDNINEEGFKKIGIWKPICNKYYRSIGHVIHPGYKPPSIHKIRCLPKIALNKSGIDNMISEGKSHITSLKGYNLWGIIDSSYFIGNDKNNSLEPIEKVYSINKLYFDVEDKLPIKKTNMYKFIWKGINKETKKAISIWRPIATEKYVSLGDIAYNGDDPNGKLDTILVHRNYAKPVEDFGDKPIIKYYVGKEIVSFWKPKPPKNYGCLGFVANKGKDEPVNNNICYSIPLKYLDISYRDNFEISWSTIQLSIQKLSIWNNDNNNFIVNNNYKYPEGIFYKLDNSLLKINRDMLDVEQNLVLKYKLNQQNREIYNAHTKERLFINSLSSRLGITPERINNFSFEDGKIIKLRMVSRPSGSEEPLVYEIINNIENQIKNSSLKINNSKNNGYIAEILFVDIDSNSINKDNIPLDNTKFIQKLI